MTSRPRKADLSPEQARALLKPIGEVTVRAVTRAATANDVFQVTTETHGAFYVKFHTARWYADQADTSFVAAREAAVHDLLRKRGMPLPYPGWADLSRTIVPAPVYVCGELPGLPVTEILARWPGEMFAVMHALGTYLRGLHDIIFTTPGILGPEHVQLAPPEGPVPPVAAWDKHAMHHPKHFQRFALEKLDETAHKGLIAPETENALRALFERMAETIRTDYTPPRFTVGNCHVWHFHMQPVGGQWTVSGFYDFEAVSAGDATIDLVEIEDTLVPKIKTFAWRTPFFSGYGRAPAFEGYKMRLLYYLLHDLSRFGAPWPEQKWDGLVRAGKWEELVW